MDRPWKRIAHRLCIPLKVPCFVEPASPLLALHSSEIGAGYRSLGAEYTCADGVLFQLGGELPSPMYRSAHKCWNARAFIISLMVTAEIALEIITWSGVIIKS